MVLVANCEEVVAAPGHGSELLFLAQRPKPSQMNFVTATRERAPMTMTINVVSVYLAACRTTPENESSGQALTVFCAQTPSCVAPYLCSYQLGSSIHHFQRLPGTSTGPFYLYFRNASPPAIAPVVLWAHHRR